jgi:hypothetical protein
MLRYQEEMSAEGGVKAMVQLPGIASVLHWSLGPATLGVGALARRAIASGVEVICGLRGHETVLHFGERRLSLKCVACGHQTPGWEIGRSTHSALPYAQSDTSTQELKLTL